MFNRFKQSSKFLSLMLALVMVFGITGNVFAGSTQANQNDAQYKMYVVKENNSQLEIIGGSESHYKEVTAGDPAVTVHTMYLEFPEGYAEDLDNVDVFVVHPNGMIIDTDQSSLVSTAELQLNNELLEGSIIRDVNFTKSYVEFEFNDANGTIYKVNSGINGKHINLKVIINLENARKWVDGTYVSENTEGYVAPKAANYPLAKTRAVNAMVGLENYQVAPVSAKIGESAMEAFKKGITGLNVVGIENGYISEIGKIGNYPTLPDRIFQRAVGAPHFPEGDYMKDRTGWIYLMNGDVANMGASQYIITASDESLTWGYTFDWGVDLGASW